MSIIVTVDACCRHQAFQWSFAFYREAAMFLLIQTSTPEDAGTDAAGLRT